MFQFFFRTRCGPALPSLSPQQKSFSSAVRIRTETVKFTSSMFKVRLGARSTQWTSCASATNLSSSKTKYMSSAAIMICLAKCMTLGRTSGASSLLTTLCLEIPCTHSPALLLSLVVIAAAVEKDERMTASMLKSMRFSSRVINFNEERNKVTWQMKRYTAIGKNETFAKPEKFLALKKYVCFT